MNVSSQLALHPRQRLSAVSKFNVAALFGLTALCGIMSFFSFALLITTILVLLSALLVVTGIRWTPLLGSLLSGYVLYVFLFKESFPVYHLIHPKDAYGIGHQTAISFGIFVIILLILCCAVMAIGTGIGATVQNYLRNKPLVSRWPGYLLVCLVGVMLGAIWIAALSQPATATAEVGNGSASVHLGGVNFASSSVTIAKGSSLTLIDDGNFAHNISGGVWQNGQPVSQQEAGAPGINNLTLNGTGKSVQIGPFTTAGTYHIYCTLHTNMTLTIIVQ